MNRSNGDEKNAAAYLKLIDDCWFHIFDYLSPNDIVRMSATCKHLLHISGKYLNDNCPELKFHVKSTKIDHFEVESTTVEADFYEYIKKLRFESANFDRKALFLQSVATANNFNSLQTLQFAFISLYQPEFNSIREVLKNVESVEMNFCQIYCATVFNTIANNASQLKKLSVKNTRSGDLLFSEVYKNLESLEYEAFSLNDVRVNNLKEFLESHEKLKKLNTSILFCGENKEVLNNTLINLDTLGVSFDEFSAIMEPIMNLSDGLIELHQTGFFKYLNVSINFTILSRDLSLIKQPIINLSQALTIKEIYISQIKNAYFDFFAYELKELEHLTVDYINDTSEILEFVRFSKNLKSIRINHMSKNDIFVESLNKEREKLEHAKKISLYVHHRNYLFQKWKNEEKLNLSKIKIVRFEKKSY